MEAVKRLSIGMKTFVNNEQLHLQEAPRAIIKATIAISSSCFGVSCTSSFALHPIHGNSSDQFPAVELLRNWQSESTEFRRIAKLHQIIYGF